MRFRAASLHPVLKNGTDEIKEDLEEDAPNGRRRLRSRRRLVELLEAGL